MTKQKWAIVYRVYPEIAPLGYFEEFPQGIYEAETRLGAWYKFLAERGEEPRLIDFELDRQFDVIKVTEGGGS